MKTKKRKKIEIIVCTPSGGCGWFSYVCDRRKIIWIGRSWSVRKIAKKEAQDFIKTYGIK